MFEGIKKLFDPAAQLASHAEKARQARAKQDWDSASFHFRCASKMVGDADLNLRDHYRNAARSCEDEIRTNKISARRRELGLDGPR